MKWWDETVCRVQTKSLSKQDGRQISIKWKLLYQMEWKMEARFFLLGLVFIHFQQQMDGAEWRMSGLFVVRADLCLWSLVLVYQVPWCRSNTETERLSFDSDHLEIIISNVRNNQSGTQTVKLFKSRMAGGQNEECWQEWAMRKNIIFMQSTLLMWGYSSVVEHLTADQEVPSSNLGAPFLLFFSFYMVTINKIQKIHFPLCIYHLRAGGKYVYINIILL